MERKEGERYGSKQSMLRGEIGRSGVAPEAVVLSSDLFCVDRR